VLFITYGRDPAIEVFVDGGENADGVRVSPLAVLTDLSFAVKEIDATRACVSFDDVEGG
jgi:hypothetical protein